MYSILWTSYNFVKPNWIKYTKLSASTFYLFRNYSHHIGRNNLLYTNTPRTCEFHKCLLKKYS